MYIDNENFEKWMEKLSKKLSEIGQDLKSLINTDTVFDENEKLLDNQDLAFLLKAFQNPTTLSGKRCTSLLYHRTKNVL